MNNKFNFSPPSLLRPYKSLAHALAKAFLLTSFLLLPIMFGCAANVQEQIETAVNKGDLAGLQSIVNENPSYDRNALVTAIESGRLDIVKFLAANGLDISDGPPARYMTPLMIAANNGQREMVQFFIDKGNDVNRALLCFIIIPESITTPEGTVHEEYDVTFRPEGHDALTHAIRNNDKVIVELLLKNGSDPARKFIIEEASNGKFINYATAQKWGDGKIVFSKDLWFQTTSYNENNVAHVATTVKFRMQRYTTPIEYAKELGFADIVTILEKR